jgi:MSHA pilin protein MshA
MKSHQSRGFTLIELVVVITILGILAAFAIPKFIALDTQARVATINGLAGSVKSAAALARSLAMVTGGNPANVVMEGATVTLTNNYPDLPGIALAVNSSVSDFTYAAATGVFAKVGAPTPANCSVTYTPPAAAGSTPTVVVNIAGC